MEMTCTDLQIELNTKHFGYLQQSTFVPKILWNIIYSFLCFYKVQ